ncbi:MAG: helicase-exonuclease AddAB subunit AddA [Ruminococcaceae bacterium]|nr:helicase-exonuclease AddAB subunit AddA [Oscillospiraceae bacterium]
MAKWTDAQLSAIESRDKTVLVSAAAGSGKTTTLTERIIRRLTDRENPADIGRFLIVTFTKAAAADLRSKISSALGAALALDPSNRHLSRQMIKLGGADICTIDSFYLGVVRKNFSALSLPSKLSMMDEGELRVMKMRILEEVIEDFYEERKTGFRAFMDAFMDSRGASDAVSELLSLYTKLSGYPEFLEYLKNNASVLENEAKMPFLSTRAGREIKKQSLEFLMHCERVYSDALEVILGDEKAAKAYGPSFTYDKEHFARTRAAIESEDYSAALSAFSGYSKIPLGALKNADEIFKEYKDLRAECTEEYDSIGERYFSFTEETLSSDALRTSDFCKILYELLTEFDRRFAEEKINCGGCDFTDNKRFTFKLFIGEDGEPTSLAREYSEKYDEIYIDEYQDTDLVQDMIFSAIAKPGGRFMVGDIKQSIYRFRGANPSVFASYKNAFPDISESEGSDSCAIYMSENFRCDRPVIDATNRICSYIFGKGPNSIGYTEKDDLVCGKRIEPEGREMKKARLTVVRGYVSSALSKMPDDERKRCEGKGSELEIRAVVGEIKRLLTDESETCEEKGVLRHIEPRDIAILTRNNSSANAIAKALSDAGIPTSARTTVNYFENPEVLLVMSLLNVIDNPQKDVYLAGVLRSPLFGFGIGELVLIRKTGDGAVSLFDDLIYASEHSENESLREKIEFFLKKLAEYREKARLLPVDKLLQYLYSDTLILSFAGSEEEEDGEPSERRANLLMLYDYARRYETGSYKGLYSFICYINDIIASGQTIEPPASSGSTNVVNVMTIHNSKGLEFPVCFIASTQKRLGGKGGGVLQFDRDTGLGVLFGEESGLALIDNAIRRAIIKKNEREDLEEEMRILYVAMTRARERLYMSAYTYSDNWEKSAERRAAFADEYSIMSSSSYLDWITSALYSLNEEERSVVDIVRLQPYDIPKVSRYSAKESVADENRGEVEAGDISALISERLSFEYEHKHMSRLPAKLSVSKLYPEVLDETVADEPFAEEISINELPSFLIPKEERASATDRGTATHTFMQFCDFERAEKQGVEEEIARLSELGYIARETASLINTSHVGRFFKSRFYREMKESLEGGGRLYREQRFNIELPASLFTADEALKEKMEDENVVVQGVIDLVIKDKDGNITLCDYKTDYLSHKERSDASLAAKKLSERHSEQLSYYAMAIEQIFGRAPSRVCIYSLPYGDALDINIGKSIK